MMCGVEFQLYEGQIFQVQVLHWRWAAFLAVPSFFAAVQVAAVKWKDLSSLSL